MKLLDEQKTQYLANKIETRYVKKDGQKQLSEEDFTTVLKDKLDNIEDNAQVNKIEIIKVNGAPQPISPLDKSVDLAVAVNIPTATDQILGGIKSSNDDGKIKVDPVLSTAELNGYQDIKDITDTVGDVNNLTTNNKDTVVEAINEINAGGYVKAGDSTVFTGDNTFTGQNEFQQPLKVADPQQDEDAVNKRTHDTTLRDKVDLNTYTQKIQDLEQKLQQREQEIQDLTDKLAKLTGEALQWAGKDTAHSNAEYTNNKQLITDYIQGLGMTLAKGILVIDNDNHTWFYDGNDWQDWGKNSVSTATQNALGVVKGSTDQGKVKVELDGTMSVNWTPISTQEIDAMFP